MKIIRWFGPVALALSLGVSAPVIGSAAVVYDNLVNSTFQYYPDNVEYGDEVELAGPDRLVTDISVSYYLGNAGGNETMQVRFYDNTGPVVGSPNLLLYDSGARAIIGSVGNRTLSLSGVNTTVPENMTWTVQFGGIETGETVGLMVMDPPVVGESGDYFWRKETDGWIAYSFGEDPAPVANFGAAITTVPEPGLWSLMASVGLFGFALWRRRNAWRS